jgi:hypothetical protein
MFITKVIFKTISTVNPIKDWVRQALQTDRCAIIIIRELELLSNATRTEEETLIFKQYTFRDGILR